MLNATDRERYARHLLLPGFGEEAQAQLRASKVLLIGAGGLGSPCALYLTAAGVGELTIVDHDVVDLTNLQRQILHSEQSVGQSKTKSAQERLQALNSQTRVNPVEASFNLENAEELVAGHDLVIDGSDNFATRFLVNDACFLGGTPLIYGSIFQYEGQLTVFDATPESPCYRCVVPELPAAGAVPNCLEAGVIGVLPGIIGSLQAMEAIKSLTGIGTTPVGKMLYYEALSTSFRPIQLAKDPNCPLCSCHARIKSLKQESHLACAPELEVQEVSVEALAKIIAGHEPYLLIDVREPQEYAECRIETSQLLPLSQLKAGASVSLPKDRPLYIHCKSGARSRQAIEILASLGYVDLSNVNGGIDAWLQI